MIKIISASLVSALAVSVIADRFNVNTEILLPASYFIFHLIFLKVFKATK